jgi:hypothetical protein
MDNKWAASRSGNYNPGGIPGNSHWVGCGVSPRASLDPAEIEPRFFGRPARSLVAMSDEVLTAVIIGCLKISYLENTAEENSCAFIDVSDVAISAPIVGCK